MVDCWSPMAVMRFDWPALLPQVWRGGANSWQQSPPPANTQSNSLLISHLHLTIITSDSSTHISWHFSALKWTRLEVLDNLEAAAGSTNSKMWHGWEPIGGQILDLAARPGSLEAIWAAARLELSRSETMWGAGGDGWHCLYFISLDLFAIKEGEVQRCSLTWPLTGPGTGGPGVWAVVTSLPYFGHPPPPTYTDGRLFWMLSIHYVLQFSLMDYGLSKTLVLISPTTIEKFLIRKCFYFSQIN